MKHVKTPTGHTSLSRREFLWLSMAASATFAHASRPEFGSSGTSHARRFGAFQEMAPGTVEPAGWLRSYLQKQMENLGSQLPEISWPFTEAYWSGAEQGESWWPWEQKAYWVDGATRLALVMHDDALLRKTAAIRDYTLQHQDADGYLGPQFFKDPKGDEHRWPQSVFFRSLTASAEAENASDKMAAVLTRHYLGDHADYGLPERNITNLEAILWCYGVTGDGRLLTLAEQAWSRYLKGAAGEVNHGDLAEDRVFADAPIVAHGVTYAETAKLPVMLYMMTGKPEYLHFAEAAQRRIFDHHMLVDGVPSTTEWFRTRTSLDGHETCDIVDHTWAWGYMLQATGDGVWGDRIERACFNAGPGAIKNDWKAVQYFSCPNQFVATLESDHCVMEHGGYMMAYQPNPGKHTACCGGNVHRLLPNYASRMWMRSERGGLAATLYGPSVLRTTVGEKHVPVVIEQNTSYPFEETITLRFAGEHAVAFPLSLRVPGWCTAPALTVNGKAVAIAAQRGFTVVERTFKPGDTLVLTFPMKLALSRWPDEGVALEHGPLVYALPIRETWSAVVEPRYTTAAFPSWNAHPASEWNYGLHVRAADLEQQVHVQRSAVTDDPWSHPPVQLTVSARKVDDYILQDHTNHGGQQFTPPLPDLTTSKISEHTEQIILVPYGCTHLRATIFPDLTTAKQS